ncbi:hypothetical protein L211DRAFT_473385 [Terfezia boudieri ATCC MYA-4762]|uniref:Uncharacterized protein n=1 Tax=Terfezia boudieri ATCC MYA-4762 TaxID=1051890 RepID=A0A3N4M3H3_9PEZI|nr:hypothetical protein L211DRAFT_473385 [Terfezia boudieri ATCC MYA-4762]
MQSSFTMAHLTRPSLPAPREIYFSFSHLHKNLVPVLEESEDSEEERPRKKEAWRKRLHIPDYRKVKIGEYYDDDLDVSCSGEGESDISARSSFESEKSVEVKPPPAPVLCAGCNFNFSQASPPASNPAIEKCSSPCNLGKHQHRSPPRKLRLKTTTHIQYKCLWPGCKIVLCAACTNLMVRPKTSGGMGGSLSALQSYLEQQRNNTEPSKPTTSESAPNTDKTDGAITADIVQAVTSTPTSPTVKRPNSDASETINVVDHAVAAAEGNIVTKAVAEIIAQKELPQKLEAVGLRENGETSQSGVHSGIVVTVKELGLVGKPKAL